jgi:phosphoglycerate dehydrogenase-like enzyme
MLRMSPKIVLPDGDPHMAAVLSRPEFAARLARLGGAAVHANVPADDDELVGRIGDAQVVILGQYLTGPVLRRLPALRLVAFTGTGAASFVDLPVAVERGIAVANVTLSPHQGYNTAESLDRMLDAVVGNIENYLAGKPASIVAGPRSLAEADGAHQA